MGNLAIIPARGGSKRIPRKNIKDFLGKPIIAYSIEAALNSAMFDEVMVSTDDEEIAAVAKHYGALVPFMRTAETAADFSTTLDVLKEVELSYKERQNKIFGRVCCIYPTAPLISEGKLKEGLNLLISGKFDVVFPVVPFSYPIWRGVMRENERTEMLWPEYKDSRSQDLRPVYHDAGQWYWYDPASISDTLFTDNTGSLILNETEVQDIDNYADWRLAEMKYKLLNNV